MANADAAAKAVMSALADVNSKSVQPVLDQATSMLKIPGFVGDTVNIPYIGSLTINDGASTANPESVTTNVKVLTADKHKRTNIDVPETTDLQYLNGAWASEMAKQCLGQLRDYADLEFMDYLNATLCYDASATYYDNVAADSLTLDDVESCVASLLSQDGVRAEDLLILASPFALGSLRSISDVTFFVTPQDAGLGMRRPLVADYNGIPIITSRAVNRLRTVACTAVSISSNVATVTVAAGHGIVPGMKIKITGITTELTTAAAVTSVGATSVVVPLTAGDGAMADGAGTIEIQAAENVILSKSHVFSMLQKLPKIANVKRETTPGHALQASMVWGRVGFPAYVRTLCSPPSST